MKITNYQSKYIAYELTRRFPPDSVEKLTAALVDAQVALNLHQIELEEKLAEQQQIKALESLRNQKRRSLFDAQDEVDRQREELIARIEGKLQHKEVAVPLFSIRWILR